MLPVGEPDEVHKPEIGAVAIADVPPHVVRTGGAQDRSGPVFPLDPLDLGGDDVERLVPADGFVARHPAIPGVAATWSGGAGSPGGVEVDAPERGENPLGRVHERAVTDGVRRVGGPSRRAETAASRRDGPRRGIAVVELDGRHADDAPVLDVDEERPPVGAGGQPDDLSRCIRHPPGPPGRVLP